MHIQYHSESCDPILNGKLVIAFDLEMANSFVNESPVICMVGMGVYDDFASDLKCTIASIVSRDEEKELVCWFLRQLQAFQKQHPQASLLSFSGSDNDVPWLQKRIDKYHISEKDAVILKRIGHLDLKREFKKRTQRDHISLKRLERLFGIERTDKLSSRQVSFMLTSLMKQGGNKGITDAVYKYLFQDVANLFHIYRRWDEVSLDKECLGEREYLEWLLSLCRRTKRCFHGRRAPLSGLSAEVLGNFYQQLLASIESAVSVRSFAEFKLPAWPDLASEHKEIKQLEDRYRTLDELCLKQGGRYWLLRDLTRPQGALAVVRNQEKQVLMIQRGPNLSRAPGCWGFPGGVMEKSELPGACAQRELKEEVNLDGNTIAMLGSSISYDGEFDLLWMEVLLNNPEAEPYPNKKEVAQVRWVSMDEISALKPLIPGTLEAVQHILGGRLKKRSKNTL